MRRHQYEYAVDAADAEGTAGKLAAMVGGGKRVLELGSGPGMITRLLVERGCRVTALELDAASAEKVAAICEAVHVCDLNDAGWPARIAGAGTFDVILAADVLEHLVDPWAALCRLPPLLSPGGRIVVSLPHAGHNALIATLVGGDFEYRAWGLLDRTHIRFFAMKNIQRLFDDAALKIVDAGFVTKAPEDTELAAHWRALPDETRAALSKNRFGDVYQVVLAAVPRSAPGEEKELVSLPLLPPMRGSLRAWARSLSLSVSRRLGGLR